MTNTTPYVQILTKIDEFSLDELIQIQTEISAIAMHLPEVKPGSNSHDVWKFTNRDLYENTFLRVYVSADEPRRGERKFTYRAEVRGDDEGSKASTLLVRKTYTSNSDELRAMQGRVSKKLEDELSRYIKCYEKKLPEMLKKHEGQWTVFKGPKPLGFYATYEEAVAAAGKAYPNALVRLIRQINK